MGRYRSSWWTLPPLPCMASAGLRGFCCNPFGFIHSVFTGSIFATILYINTSRFSSDDAIELHFNLPTQGCLISLEHCGFDFAKVVRDNDEENRTPEKGWKTVFLWSIIEQGSVCPTFEVRNLWFKLEAGGLLVVLVVDLKEIPLLQRCAGHAEVQQYHSIHSTPMTSYDCDYDQHLEFGFAAKHRRCVDGHCQQ